MKTFEIVLVGIVGFSLAAFLIYMAVTDLDTSNFEAMMTEIQEIRDE